MSLLPVLRAWFFGTAEPPADIPAGRRSIAAVTHRRTAVLENGRTAILSASHRDTVLERGRTIALSTHRRTAEVAR